MTPTTLAPPPRRTLSPRKPPSRWAGVAFGLLFGWAVVCHGCHGGDHDDELSLTGGKPHAVRRQEEPPPTTPGAEAPGEKTPSPDLSRH